MRGLKVIYLYSRKDLKGEIILNPFSLLKHAEEKFHELRSNITWVIEVGVNGDHNELIDQCEKNFYTIIYITILTLLKLRSR